MLRRTLVHLSTWQRIPFLWQQVLQINLPLFKFKKFQRVIFYQSIESFLEQDQSRRRYFHPVCNLILFFNILRDSSDAQNVLSASNSRNSPSSFSMSADFRCNKNSLPRFTSTACSIVLLNLKNANIQDEP